MSEPRCARRGGQNVGVLRVAGDDTYNASVEGARTSLGGRQGSSGGTAGWRFPRRPQECPLTMLKGYFKRPTALTSTW